MQHRLPTGENDQAHAFSAECHSTWWKLEKFWRFKGLNTNKPLIAFSACGLTALINISDDIAKKEKWLEYDWSVCLLQSRYMYRQ